jgi:hypothetical protein
MRLWIPHTRAEAAAKTIGMSHAADCAPGSSDLRCEFEDPRSRSTMRTIASSIRLCATNSRVAMARVEGRRESARLSLPTTACVHEEPMRRKTARIAGPRRSRAQADRSASASASTPPTESSQVASTKTSISR